MQNKMNYNPGDTAYIIESRHIIREVQIVRVSGDIYTLRFTDTKGGVKLREGRLYPSKEAAEEAIKGENTTFFSQKVGPSEIIGLELSILKTKSEPNEVGRI